MNLKQLPTYGVRLFALLLVAIALSATAGSTSAHAIPATPDFGANVIIFDPSMPTSHIQTTVDTIATQQISNQFGPERYALLFKPGTYGSSTAPLNFQVGYYTAVAGLGLSPNDVVINGSIDVYNQCDNGKLHRARQLLALVVEPDHQRDQLQFRLLYRRILGSVAGRTDAAGQVNGATTLMDYCTRPSFASGGFIADSQFTPPANRSSMGRSSSFWCAIVLLTAGQMVSGTRCSRVWSVRPPNVSLFNKCCGPYTTLAPARSHGKRRSCTWTRMGAIMFSSRRCTTTASGTSWGSWAAAGRSIPIDQFFIAKPTDDDKTINTALAHGKNLIFTPGHLSMWKTTIKVTRPDTIVLGLGFATLVPQKGVIAMTVADVSGVGFPGSSSMPGR